MVYGLEFELVKLKIITTIKKKKKVSLKLFLFVKKNREAIKIGFP